MMGFKYFDSAQATIDGNELHHMHRKGQHINTANQSVFDQFYALALSLDICIFTTCNLSSAYQSICYGKNCKFDVYS